MPTDHFQQAATIIANAKTELNAVEGLKDHSQVLLGANHALDTLFSRFTVLSGSKPLSPQAVKKFAPVTKFMGKDISRPKKIKQGDLSPVEAHKEATRAKVKDLYAVFNTMDAAAILETNKTPEDITAVRAVAKRAGLEDFKDAELSIAYIEKIQKAIADKQAAHEQQEKIDEAADKLKHDAKNDEHTDDKAIADKQAADLKAGAEINKAGAADASGNKKIHKGKTK